VREALRQRACTAVPCTVVQAWPPRIGSPHSGQRRSTDLARAVSCSWTRVIIAVRAARIARTLSCEPGEVDCLESIDIRFPYLSCVADMACGVAELRC
jgi:hypothetical protein